MKSLPRSMAAFAVLAATPSLAQSGPTPAQMLDSLRTTVAIVEFCDLDVPLDTALRLARSGVVLERRLGISRTDSDARYLALKERMVAVPPDCSPDGPDLAGINGVLGLDRP